MSFDPTIVTHVRRKQLINYKNMLADTDREKRIHAQMCIFCYYTKCNRTSGSTFTRSKCKHCSKDMQFTNTDIDAVCYNCATELGLCKHCGAKINFHLTE